MKKINPHTFPYIAIVILVIIGFALLWFANQQYHNAVNWKAKFEYSNSKIDTLLNKQGLKVAETFVSATFDEKEIKKISAEIFDLKKSLERKIKEVNALVVANQKIVYKDSTKIYYEPYPYNYNKDSLVKLKDVIIPPRKFNTINKNIAIAGTVLLDGVKIDSVQLNNTVSFRIAEKRKNIFSKKETVVQVINSNPLFNTTDLKSLTLKQKSTSWQKWIKPVVATVATIIIKNQLK